MSSKNVSRAPISEDSLRSSTIRSELRRCGKTSCATLFSHSQARVCFEALPPETR